MNTSGIMPPPSPGEPGTWARASGIRNMKGAPTPRIEASRSTAKYSCAGGRLVARQLLEAACADRQACPPHQVQVVVQVVQRVQPRAQHLVDPLQVVQVGAAEAGAGGAGGVRIQGRRGGRV